MYTNYSYPTTVQDIQYTAESVYQGSGYMPCLVPSLFPLVPSIKTEEVDEDEKHHPQECYEHQQQQQQQQEEKIHHHQEKIKKSCLLATCNEQELLLTSGYYPYENFQSPSSSTSSSSCSFSSAASTPASEKNYIRCSSEEYSTISSPEAMSIFNYSTPYDGYLDTATSCSSDITTLQVMLSEQQQRQQQPSSTCDMSYFPSTISTMGSPCSTSTSLVSSPSSDVAQQQQLLSMTNFDFYHQHSLTNAALHTTAAFPKYDLNTFYNDPYFLFQTTPALVDTMTKKTDNHYQQPQQQQKRRTLTTITTATSVESSRPYPCHLCTRAFARKHDLQRHIRVHTGDKPYSCPCCKKAFARTDALKRHLRVEDQCRTSPEVQVMKETGRRRYKNL